MTVWVWQLVVDRMCYSYINLLVIHVYMTILCILLSHRYLFNEHLFSSIYHRVLIIGLDNYEDQHKQHKQTIRFDYRAVEP